MISIIIPTLNEERGISKILSEIPDSINNEKVEIIVTDSDSTDNTRKVAKKLGAKVINIKKRGKWLAVKKGMSESRGDKLVFIDSDGEHNPKYIPFA